MSVAERGQMQKGAVDLLAAQNGVITRKQALQLGMSASAIDRRLGSGEWERIFPAVYRTAFVAPSWQQRLAAGYLWAGDDAVVSHLSAGALLGLDGIEPGTIDITVPRPRRAPSSEVTLHFTGPLSGRDTVRRGCLLVTNATRTIIDLASTVDDPTLEGALDSALRMRITAVGTMRKYLDVLGTKGRKGAGRLVAILDERDPRAAPVESILETGLLRLLKRAGLPAPVRQYEVREGRRLIARLDFAYPDLLLAIECDGYRYHSGKREWERDRSRLNALTTLGWRIFHFTWKDLQSGGFEFMESLRRALG